MTASDYSLQQLLRSGQSYWLDNLTRQMISSGELSVWIRKGGLRGITATPTTFHDALNSEDYDQFITSMFHDGCSTDHVLEALLLTDVQQACDLLHEVYCETEGHDGVVSLEVSPHLAHDSRATMAQARLYVERVNRPNLAITIPATDAGIPAIEQLLYEGIPTNVTLLFSIPSYQAVIEAYLSALERRLTDHQPLQKISSVAGFLVSRIDVLADQLLQRRVPLEDHTRHSLVAQLQGRVAIANAKLAYRTFRQAFDSPRWELLAAAGAPVQRLLWASMSSTKPAVRDVVYVESLVGRNTVVTMSESTLRAFAEHGEVVPDMVERNVEEAELVMQQLEKVGISFNCLTWQLEHEGIQRFVDAYDNAIQMLEGKRRHLA